MRFWEVATTRPNADSIRDAIERAEGTGTVLEVDQDDRNVARVALREDLDRVWYNANELAYHNATTSVYFSNNQ